MAQHDKVLEAQGTAGVQVSEVEVQTRKKITGNSKSTVPQQHQGENPIFFCT